MKDLVRAALAGERRSIARLLSLVEDDSSARDVIPLVHPHTGSAHLIGVTGAPGSGKSTLVACIAREYRRRGLTVGIVAVDPSSPFSGGAILGDRIRMASLSGDAGVFVRSMASRGNLGGLARGTANAVRVLDACGFRRILIETVGAGQSEVDIARTAQTILVVQVPGGGDDVQTMKAGILEIADILVVNKADLEGAERVATLLGAALSLGADVSAEESSARWHRPILKTVATSGNGVESLVDAIEGHARFLAESGGERHLERARVADELRALMRDELLARCLKVLGSRRVEASVERIVDRQADPCTEVRELLMDCWRGLDEESYDGRELAPAAEQEGGLSPTPLRGEETQ